MSRTSQRERPIHQGHSRKYSHSEEQNNLLRAKILPYDFTGKSEKTGITFVHENKCVKSRSAYLVSITKLLTHSFLSSKLRKACGTYL